MRAGSDYMAALRDGRQVFLDGEAVEDVTTHPAFHRQVDRVAALYDLVRDEAHAERLSAVDPATGERHCAMWLVPHSAEDLTRRRRVHTAWAEGSYGLMGRTPDHVASVLTGFASRPEVFARCDPRFADNVRRFHEWAKRNDPYIAYTIVPPQVDRAKPAHAQPEPFLYAGVCAERDDGIVVRGAQMIGTAAPLADYLFLSYITPLREGDEDYAVSAVIPCSAPGLRIYPRRPYASGATSVFDYPLSSRFDESDSVVVFDDVFVPWEHVFAVRDIGVVRAQFFETAAHTLANFQSLVRFTTKLHFAAGLARRLAQLHNIDRIPPVQALLGGEIATVVATIEAVTQAAERDPRMHEGVAWPNPQYVYAGMRMQRTLVTNLLRQLRELAGGAFLAVPSSEDSFLSPATAADTRRYYASVSATADERVKFLKLMWDFVGTEFAGRQLQYEMFYSAAQHVVDVRVFDNFDWEPGLELVRRCLDEYSLGEPGDGA